MRKIGVIFSRAATISGRKYKVNEFATLAEPLAEGLVNAGTARRADGGPATRPLIDRDAHSVRAFNIPAGQATKPAPGRSIAPARERDRDRLRLAEVS